MNTASSGGCESGWTDYFVESLASPNQYQVRGVCDHLTTCKPLSYEDEEEDLSMVSDASSGPPHFHYYPYHEEEAKGVVEWFPKHGFSSSKEKSKSKKLKETRGKHQDLCLDDTANSPVFSCPKSCVDSSSNQKSISHGKSSFHSQFGFSAEPSVICGGRKRK